MQGWVKFMLIAATLSMTTGWASDFSTVKQKLITKYPSIPMIDADGLYQQLDLGQTHILLDARSPREYTVSHIYQAHNTPNIKQALNLLQDKNYQTPIFVYCSLGYRSAELSSQLRQHGYSEVVNVAGSLFEWVENGYPVYQGDKEVRQVHPFNLWWGRYLRSDYRSYDP